MSAGTLSQESRQCLVLLVECLEVLGDWLERDGLEDQLRTLVDQAIEKAAPENRVYRIVKVENT